MGPSKIERLEKELIVAREVIANYSQLIKMLIELKKGSAKVDEICERYGFIVE